MKNVDDNSHAFSLSYIVEIRICASFVRYKMEYKAINLPANRESRGSVFFSKVHPTLAPVEEAKSRPHYKVIKTHY